MDMSGFSELIKNFGKTRDYVRDFFIYGCKVRNDFDKKSARTYDDEKRRVESWMGDCIRYDDSVRGRQVSISVDCGKIPENPLYNAYYARSFTDNDIRLHFLLTDSEIIQLLFRIAQLFLRARLRCSDFVLFFVTQPHPYTSKKKSNRFEPIGFLFAKNQSRAYAFCHSSALAGDIRLMASSA